MTETKNGTITYNGTEYLFEDLNERAKYIVQQVNELRVEELDLRNKLTRLDVTVQAFSDLLGKELEAEAEAEEKETSSED